MQGERELTVSAVKSMMRKFRQDEAAFYSEYGGGPSILYDLLDGQGRRYPLAAIVQAAIGAEDVKGGVKAPNSAGRMLRDLGFRVLTKGSRLKEGRTPEKNALAALEEIAETERKVVTAGRVGAEALRRFVLAHRIVCEVSGLPDHALLRVSHIVPWSEDEESRLDPENVILLSALWDQAFDQGLVSFNSAGVAVFSKRLSKQSKNALKSSEAYSIAMTNRRESYLLQHRAKHGFDD